MIDLPVLFPTRPLKSIMVWQMNTESAAQELKVRALERLGQGICRVFVTRNVGKGHIVRIDTFLDVVVLYVNIFRPLVKGPDFA